MKPDRVLAVAVTNLIEGVGRAIAYVVESSAAQCVFAGLGAGYGDSRKTCGHKIGGAVVIQRSPTSDRSHHDTIASRFYLIVSEGQSVWVLFLDGWKKAQ